MLCPERLILPTVLHRAPRPFFFLILLGLFLLAGCGFGDPPATPTRIPTRPRLAARQPTKVARRASTETPQPTRTPRPTRTQVPTLTATPPPENKARAKKNVQPTEAVALAAANDVPAPPTAEPTIEPTLAPTEPPTPAPTATEAPLTDDGELAVNAPCDATGGGNYGVLGAGGWEGRDPATHADLNLAVRGYKVVNAFRGLVDYDGETDDNAPQLWGLFADRRTPDILHTYQVYDWDWGSNSRGDLIQDFEVTMASFRVADGETIYTPDFGGDIGEGYVALVLYADAHRVTLKYTGEDNVIDGYTLHLEGICVYANLLNLYNERQAAGRGALPALRPGQPIGYVPGDALGVAIRDRGAFLDPRSRKDWWKGR